MTALDERVPPPLSTSSVPPAFCLPKGAHAHRRGVQQLIDSYRAIPAGQTVRLAKRTSNLFRPRIAATAQGLDVSGLAGVISIDAAARTADVAGHVHLRAPGRRHPGARADAAGRAAAEDDHPRRRGHRPGHRVHAPSATVCRTSPCSSSTCSPVPASSSPRRPRVSTRPVRRLPELLRHARLRAPAEDRARAGAALRRPAARALRRPRRAHRGHRRRSAGSAAGEGEPGRLPRRRRVLRGGVLPDAGHAGRTTSPRPATTPGQQIYYRSIQRPRPGRADRSTTTCGAGTPTGSGARGRSAPSTRGCGGCGRRGTGAATSTTGSSAWRTGTTWPRGSTPGGAGRRGSASSRTSRSRSERTADFLRWFLRARRR